MRLQRFPRYVAQALIARQADRADLPSREALVALVSHFIPEITQITAQAMSEDVLRNHYQEITGDRLNAYLRDLDFADLVEPQEAGENIFEDRITSVNWWEDGINPMIGYDGRLHASATIAAQTENNFFTNPFDRSQQPAAFLNIPDSITARMLAAQEEQAAREAIPEERMEEQDRLMGRLSDAGYRPGELVEGENGQFVWTLPLISTQQMTHGTDGPDDGASFYQSDYYTGALVDMHLAIDSTADPMREALIIHPLHIYTPPDPENTASEPGGHFCALGLKLTAREGAADIKRQLDARITEMRADGSDDNAIRADDRVQGLIKQLYDVEAKWMDSTQADFFSPGRAYKAPLENAITSTFPNSSGRVHNASGRTYVPIQRTRPSDQGATQLCPEFAAENAIQFVESGGNTRRIAPQESEEHQAMLDRLATEREAARQDILPSDDDSELDDQNPQGQVHVLRVDLLDPNNPQRGATHDHFVRAQQANPNAIFVLPDNTADMQLTPERQHERQGRGGLAAVMRPENTDGQPDLVVMGVPTVQHGDTELTEDIIRQQVAKLYEQLALGRDIIIPYVPDRNYTSNERPAFGGNNSGNTTPEMLGFIRGELLQLKRYADGDLSLEQLHEDYRAAIARARANEVQPVVMPHIPAPPAPSVSSEGEENEQNQPDQPEDNPDSPAPNTTPAPAAQSSALNEEQYEIFTQWVANQYGIEMVTPESGERTAYDILTLPTENGDEPIKLKINPDTGMVTGDRLKDPKAQTETLKHVIDIAVKMKQLRGDNTPIQKLQGTDAEKRIMNQYLQQKYPNYYNRDLALPPAYSPPRPPRPPAYPGRGMPGAVRQPPGSQPAPTRNPASPTTPPVVPPAGGPGRGPGNRS